MSKNETSTSRRDHGRLLLQAALQERDGFGQSNNVLQLGAAGVVHQHRRRPTGTVIPERYFVVMSVMPDQDAGTPEAT